MGVNQKDMIVDDSFLSALGAALESRGLVLLGAGELGDGQPTAFARFQSWLAAGYHGAMAYLENHLPIRKDPRLLLDGANIAIVVGLPYFHHENNLRFGPEKSQGESSAQSSQVARYSVLKDYHREIPRRVKAALAEVKAQQDDAVRGKGDELSWHYRIVTDSAPLLERAVAEQHSRGFIGKNTMFIHPRKGSFILLAEIIAQGSLTLRTATGKLVAPERRSPDGGCGSCTRCQSHCPTDALATAYTLNAKNCLSYWSIEHRGAVPFRFWRHFASYLFGCDICQTTCPYNRAVKKQRQLARDMPLRSLPEAAEVVTMSQSQYETWFGGIAMTRAKKDGLRRNALLALAAAKPSPAARHRLAVSLRQLSAEALEPNATPTAALTKAGLDAAAASAAFFSQ